MKNVCHVLISLQRSLTRSSFDIACSNWQVFHNVNVILSKFDCQPMDKAFNVHVQRVLKIDHVLILRCAAGQEYGYNSKPYLSRTSVCNLLFPLLHWSVHYYTDQHYGLYRPWVHTKRPTLSPKLDGVIFLSAPSLRSGAEVFKILIRDNISSLA